MARVDQPAALRFIPEPPAPRAPDQSDPHQILATIDKMIHNLSRVTSAERRQDHGSTSGRRPESLCCTLPLEDPEIYSAVKRYVVKLRQQVQAMRSACQRRDFVEVSQLAHWLKGSGGTLGFDAFTVPAKTLEAAAKEGNAQRMEEALRDIAELVAAIYVPNTAEPIETDDASTDEASSSTRQPSLRSSIALVSTTAHGDE